jgi:hypothetical protein
MISVLALNLDDRDNLDENQLLEALTEDISGKFFNYADYVYHRTRNTVAVLDYQRWLRDGRPERPLLSQFLGESLRYQILVALKRAGPDRHFRNVGFEHGKARVGPDKNIGRIGLLLAANDYPKCLPS